MTQEFEYQHGVFTVTLIEAGEGEVRQWDGADCECQGFNGRRRKTNIYDRATESDAECRHIREAKLYHWLNQKIAATDEEMVDQQTLDTYTVTNLGDDD